MTGLFLAWYLLYVLLADYAHDFMSTKVVGNINIGLILGLLQFVSTFVDHDAVRPARQQEPRPARREDPATRSRETASEQQPGAQHQHLRRLRRWSPWSSCSGPAATPRPRPTTTPPAAPSPARRTASRSRATTCPPRRSSASPAPSRSTATTASCTPSASWWRGWSRCCWSPSCCATPASTRWATCWLPDAAAPGPRGGGDVDDGRLVLLPAGPDGRRGRPRRAAARHHRQGRPGARHRRRRRADDRLRAHRRHEGHHLGADHQGRAADRRRGRDDRLGARQVRLQPVARCSARPWTTRRRRARSCSTPACSTA